MQYQNQRVTQLPGLHLLIQFYSEAYCHQVNIQACTYPGPSRAHGDWVTSAGCRLTCQPPDWPHCLQLQSWIHTVVPSSIPITFITGLLPLQASSCQITEGCLYKTFSSWHMIKKKRKNILNATFRKCFEEKDSIQVLFGYFRCTVLISSLISKRMVLLSVKAYWWKTRSQAVSIDKGEKE